MARQGLPGAYGDTFAGFDDERETGIVLFTGERIRSASARHILGEETCRALRLLAVSDAPAQAALQQANDGVLGFLERAARDPGNTNPGYFCCNPCTVGLWRNLLSGGVNRREERLSAGLRKLRSERVRVGPSRQCASLVTPPLMLGSGGLPVPAQGWRAAPSNAGQLIVIRKATADTIA